MTCTSELRLFLMRALHQWLLLRVLVFLSKIRRGPKEDVTGMRMTWGRPLDRVFHYMQDMQLDAGANRLLV